MTTYYKATFSDGSVLKRSTVSRKYSHAWKVRYTTDAGFQGGAQGFSRTEQLARKELLSRTRRPVDFAEAAPTVEITAAEYRSLA